MRRVMHYILALVLLCASTASAQGWRGSVNGQETFSGTAARPQIANGPTLGTAAFPWLALYTKNIFVPTGGLFTCTAAGIATISTDCISILNGTAATVGATIQYSPRLKWCGSGYNSVSTMGETNCFAAEVRPTTAAGATANSLIFLSSLNGNATFTNLASVDSAGTWNSQQFSAGNTSYYQWNGRARMYSPADGQVNAVNQANTIGSQLKVDALPTVASGFGTSPAITAGSTPFAGSINVGSGAPGTGGVINFNGTAFPSAPFIVCMDDSSLLTIRCTATTTQLTIVATALTASDVVSWIAVSSK